MANNKGMIRSKSICPSCHKVKGINCTCVSRKAFDNINKDNYTIYNSYRWRTYAKKYRLSNPLCVECLSEGRTTMSEVVDHIIPIDKGGDVWSADNHQALCHKHHNSKTGKSK